MSKQLLTNILLIGDLLDAVEIGKALKKLMDSPQFLIEPEPYIQTVSWDEIFYDSGMVNTGFIENWEDFDTPKNKKNMKTSMGLPISRDKHTTGQIIGEIKWSDKHPYGGKLMSKYFKLTVSSMSMHR